MIIADTSGLIALLNAAEPAHRDVSRYMASTNGPFVVSPYVVAELDYLVLTRIGVEAEMTILRELSSDAYELAHVDVERLAAIVDIVERYRDHAIGAADASLVVLAHEYGTRTILTLDNRHFGILRPLDGGHFKLVPS